MKFLRSIFWLYLKKKNLVNLDKSSKTFLLIQDDAKVLPCPPQLSRFTVVYSEAGEDRTVQLDVTNTSANTYRVGIGSITSTIDYRIGYNIYYFPNTN